MSMSFSRPLRTSEQDFIRSVMTDIVAIDANTVLFDSDVNWDGAKDIADKVNQTVTVSADNIDDIKEMNDGTKYKVTDHGWVKI